MNKKELHGSAHRWGVLLSTTTAYFYDSLALLVLTLSMPVLLKVLNISLAQGGALTSASMLGAAVGSIFLGVLAERKGRKFTMILSLVCFGIGSGLSVLLHSFAAWVILRFLTCIGVGGVYGPALCLIANHWDKDYAPRGTALVLSAFPIAAIFASWLSKISLATDWRILYYVAATSIIAAVVCYFAIPSDKVESENRKTAETKPKVGFSSLFKGGFAKITILGLLLNFAHMGGLWGFSSWAPTYMVNVLGFPVERMALFTIIQHAGMLISYFACSSLVKKTGGRRIITVCLIINIVAIPLYAIIPNTAILTCMGLAVGFANGGNTVGMALYFKSLYPEKMAALGTGFLFNGGRIGSVLAPFTIGLIGDYFGLKIGLLFTPIIYVVGLVAIVCLPSDRSVGRTA